MLSLGCFLKKLRFFWTFRRVLQSDDRSRVCILFARLERRVAVYQIAIVRDMV
jgi:hypothetical protein